MSTRSRTLALLTAFVAVSSALSAQTYTFTQTELGRIVPARFATTTQALMADVDLTVAPTIALTAEATESGANAASGDVSTWNAVAAIEADDESKPEKDADGFFSSTMGRASIAGLAGLAGASYFALRSNASSLPSDQALFTTASTIAPVDLPGIATTFTVNPEPASMALMAFGLAGLAVVARRRRSN